MDAMVVKIGKSLVQVGSYLANIGTTASSSVTENVCIHFDRIVLVVRNGWIQPSEPIWFLSD